MHLLSFAYRVLRYRFNLWPRGIRISHSRRKKSKTSLLFLPHQIFPHGTSAPLRSFICHELSREKESIPAWTHSVRSKRRYATTADGFGHSSPETLSDRDAEPAPRRAGSCPVPTVTHLGSSPNRMEKPRVSKLLLFRSLAGPARNPAVSKLR